jgi:hypothetical protein
MGIVKINSTVVMKERQVDRSTASSEGKGFQEPKTMTCPSTFNGTTAVIERFTDRRRWSFGACRELGLSTHVWIPSGQVAHDREEFL